MPPPKIGKIWFVGIKSWFFTRNTPKISRLPLFTAIFLSAPPLTWNPGSPLVCIIIWWMRPSWSWSYGSWVYNYLCNQCLSPLKLCSWRGVLYTTLCDKVCQWLSAGLWFFIRSSNKTDRHDITEILLKVTLNTITLNSYKIIIFWVHKSKMATTARQSKQPIGCTIYISVRCLNIQCQKNNDSSKVRLEQ